MIRRAFLSRAGLAPVACAAAVAVPSSARADTAGDGQAERNARIVEDALRVVFSDHRVDQVDTYFAPDFVQYSPYAPSGGRDVLKAWWAGFVYSVPDVTTTMILPPVAQGQDVADFRIVTGTVVHDLPALGITAHGQHLEFRAADIFRVVRGQIVAHWETVDTGPIVGLATSLSSQRRTTRMGETWEIGRFLAAELVGLAARIGLSPGSRAHQAMGGLVTATSIPEGCNMILPATRLTIELIPHCTSVAPDGWVGSHDVRPLTELGTRQAEALVAVIGSGVDAIYSSPAVRCRQTVGPLAAAAGLPVHDLAELYEARDFREPAAGTDQMPELMARALGGAWAAGRMLRAVTLMMDAHPRGRVVAASHGDVIPALLATLSSAFAVHWPRHVGRGGWFTLRFAPGGLAVTPHDPVPAGEKAAQLGVGQPVSRPEGLQ